MGVYRVPTNDILVQWTRSIGSYNYALVNDYFREYTPPDDWIDDTKYNSTSDTGKEDRFGFPSWNIKSVRIDYLQIIFRAKSSEVSDKLNAFIRVGGTNYTQEVDINDSFTDYYGCNWTTNPATGLPWTDDQINGIGSNALQAFGYISSDDQIGTVQVSSIYADLWYIPYYGHQYRKPSSDQVKDWTPSSGSDNYKMVDEFPTMNDTDYNESSVADNVDRFGFTAFQIPTDSPPDAIDSVLQNVRAQYTGSPDEWQTETLYEVGDIIQIEGSPYKCNTEHTSDSEDFWYDYDLGYWDDHNKFVIFLRINGVDYEQEAWAGMEYFYDAYYYWENNPETLFPWTPETINSIQAFGYKSVNDGPIQISETWLDVHYWFTKLCLPTTDASVQWTPSTGSDNYVMVAKLVYDDSTWNRADGGSEIDKFTFENPSLDSTVIIKSVYGDVYGRAQGSGVFCKIKGWVNGNRYGPSKFGSGAWQEVIEFIGSNLNWNGNPVAYREWSIDDLNGVGENALTHIGYEASFSGAEKYFRVCVCRVKIDYYKPPGGGGLIIGSSWPLPCFSLSTSGGSFNVIA
jgi:hypothetical protein